MLVLRDVIIICSIIEGNATVIDGMGEKVSNTYFF